MIEFAFSSNLLSPSWWIAYLLDFSQREPAHLAIELACIGIILYLAFSKQYTFHDSKLSKKEEDALIAEWVPEPLVPENYAETHPVENPFIVESATGATAIIDGEEYLNFASTNFLGIADRSEIKAAAADVITRYGVGSCGPRGFYGTIDMHLQLEKTFSNFMGVEDAILYSDGIACLSSVIPAFCKSGDSIIADETVNFGIQLGLKLSRSKITYFNHNDLKSLEEKLIHSDKTTSKESKLKHRRFIVCEGISQFRGDISPIKSIVELAKKYKFRVILDDTLAIGVLGKTGRGSFEHWGLKVSDIDIICATIDTTIASVGGICVGSKQVVSHQRLSGAGYCFSAASPPYTAKAATTALGLIDANPQLTSLIRAKSALFHSGLVDACANIGLEVTGAAESPISYVRIAKGDAWNVDITNASQVTNILKAISDKLRIEHHVIACVSTTLPDEVHKQIPSIKFFITTLHSEEDLKNAIITFKKVAIEVRDEREKNKCNLNEVVESGLSQRKRA